MALQARYSHGKRIENAFQTNGALLDDAWGDFLAANRFLVGISIDGPRISHDAYRVDKGDLPTFDRVMAGVAVLKRAQRGVQHANDGAPKELEATVEVYRFLREIGSGYLQFIPIVERTARGAGKHSGLWRAPPPD